MDVNAKKALKIRIRFGNVCAFVLVEDTLKNHPLASIKQIQGTKVAASCLQKLFERFEKHLIQDDCLFIHRPSLAENKLNFKFAEKEHKVAFFFNTLVTKCNSWSGSEHGFVFTDYKSTLDKSGSNGNSIALGSILDVIGYVVICYPMESTTTKLELGKRMTLKLRDVNNLYSPMDNWMLHFRE
ncbi:hypothetical protein HanIR_Chr15g0779151 [Helianthus annuus]|nr:hypothetical protein HanIR_Chr15g0779151 [Helianthus annuus]